MKTNLSIITGLFIITCMFAQENKNFYDFTVTEEELGCLLTGTQTENLYFFTTQSIDRICMML